MNKTRITILICVLLALVTLGAFWRVLGCGFVDYDDQAYVTDNHWVQAGPTWESVRWAFTTFHASNWHPLTWLSHMLDCRIYGLNPMGHHLTNLILHILTTMLLFLLLQRMTGSRRRSAFVAALFALHPLHVGSVAWVAERKDVLSGLFWILTMHAYVSYVGHPARRRYVLALTLFALGLMAKPMLVTLPVILLLIDYWPLGRFKSSHREGEAPSEPAPSEPGHAAQTELRPPGVGMRALIWEKAPFFVLSGVSSVITYLAQQRGAAVVAADNVSVGIRIANALVSYVAYLVKMLWPQRLAAVYSHPLNHIPVWQVVGSALLLAAISILVLRASRTRPYLAVGWLWYLITLVPVIGFVQVGMQAMADRYTYIPLIGVFIALTWGIADLVGPVGPVRQVGRIPAILIIAACAAGTWHQTGYWKNSITLFQRAVDVSDRNFMAETNLGAALIDNGRYKEGFAHAQASIRITPTARGYRTMGKALLHMDRPAEALPYYEKALRLDPTSPVTHSNLGFIMLDSGKVGKAIEHFTASLRAMPDEALPHFGLGLALMQKGRTEDAAREYREAVRLDPKNVPANNALGMIAFKQGKTDEAIGYFEAVTRLSPDPEAHYRLGSILASQRKIDEAIEHFRSAIRLEPRYPEAHYDLAVALSAKGRFDEAIEHYREAVKIAPNYANAHKYLAIALYLKGDYALSRKEVRLAQKYGARMDPEFLKALSDKTRQ